LVKIQIYSACATSYIRHVHRKPNYSIMMVFGEKLVV